MPTLKAGTILMNLETKKIALVYRPKRKDYSFPKGHLEPGESLIECAIRETEEETMRANHLLRDDAVYTLQYTTPLGEDCETYMYLAVDDGPTQKEIAIDDREEVHWIPFEQVESKLSYSNLKEMWHSLKQEVYNILRK